MTVAAAEAMTLRGLLARQAVPDTRRYFRAITAAIDVAWDIAVSADLAFPRYPANARRRCASSTPTCPGCTPPPPTITRWQQRWSGSSASRTAPKGCSARTAFCGSCAATWPAAGAPSPPRPARRRPPRQAGPGATSAVTGSRLPSPSPGSPAQNGPAALAPCPAPSWTGFQAEYDTVRLHASIGYGTPDDEHQGQGEAVRQARCDGLAAARARTALRQVAGANRTSAPCRYPDSPFLGGLNAAPYR